MTQTSRPWDGVATGDATTAPYDAATEWAETRMPLNGSAALANKGGVYDSVLNGLVISMTDATTVSIASGEADVYGTWYRNDSANAITVPKPSSANRTDRIVLRKSWASQTIRLTRLAGTEGGAPAALTQIAGTTWDIPIATVLTVPVTGISTVNDARQLLLGTPTSSTNIILEEQSSAPADPGSGLLAIYARTNGGVYTKEGASGIERPIMGGSLLVQLMGTSAAVDVLKQEVIATAGGITATLPDPASVPVYSYWLIKARVGISGVVTVAPHASETIDGAASFTLSARDAAFFQTNELGNWEVF